jgi:diketogulonate reductase-like aldo/keto reductase
MSKVQFNRRDIMKAGLALSATPAWGASLEMIQTRPIPASGEALPVVGLGTYKAFDVYGWWWEIRSRRAIIDRMIEVGATLIDSSPQYAPSEEILGDVIEADNRRQELFLATKVWTDGQESGAKQMQESEALMRAEGRIDLMQVHNLRDTDLHMATIRELQQDGKIRYNGLTHWEATALDDLQQAMQKHKPEFIQINYSLGEREAEERVLPMAKEMGIAVLINRPYMHGQLFRAVKDRSLPDWATEFADSWGQFFLKFILSHPAVHCVIPATSDFDHLEDNLGAGTGPMPDAATRARIVSYFESL